MQDISSSNVGDSGGSALPSPPKTNYFVDKLTLEYMMNRNHYTKYLAKTNREKYQEVQDKIETIQASQDYIHTIFNDLLTDYLAHGNYTKYNTSINTAFDNFLQKCMQYIEENPECPYDEDGPGGDEDMMFADTSQLVRKRGTSSQKYTQDPRKKEDLYVNGVRFFTRK
jgi:hypothetical protein